MLKKSLCVAFFTAFMVHLFIIASSRPTPVHDDDLDVLNWVEEAIKDCYEDDAKSKPVILTKEGIRSLSTGLADISRNTKCIRYCILKAKDLLTRDNLLIPDSISSLIHYASDYKYKLEEIETIVKRCNVVAKQEKDKCERAHLSQLCIFAELAKVEAGFA